MKYGFVYIWRDRRDNRFYIGSHWGNETDGYICSSLSRRGMKAQYIERPTDFNRRIVARIYTNHKELLEEEQRWLDRIPAKEFGGKYYNLSASVRGMLLLSEAAQKEARRKSGLKHRGRKLGPKSEEVRRKISESRKGKCVGIVFSQERRENIRIAVTGLRHSEETKRKISDNTRKQFQNEESKRRHKEALTGRRLSGEHCRNISKGLKNSDGRLNWSAGTMWITNETNDRQIRKGVPIPDGYRKGRRDACKRKAA